MKIVFSEEDIEQMLIEKAAQMGLIANTCEVEVRYGSFRGATVWFKEEKEPVVAVEAFVIQPQ